jgi:hypothetical protein
VGRKLHHFARNAGLEGLDTRVEVYHLVAGQIDTEQERLWRLKLSIAEPTLAQVFNDPARAHDLVERFMDYLRRPDSITYSNVFTVTGHRPS